MKPRDLRDLRPQRGWKPTLLSVQSGAVTTVIADHGNGYRNNAAGAPGRLMSAARLKLPAVRAALSAPDAALGAGVNLLRF
jgi:hypothetical protein